MGLDLTGIGAASDAISKILGLFFGDKTQEERDKAAQALAVLQMQAQQNLAQTQVNADAQAKEPFTFRDAAGWTCVAGFMVNVLRPIITWVAIGLGHPVELPAMDTSESGPILIGLLGLGGLHAYQKVNS